MVNQQDSQQVFMRQPLISVFLNSVLDWITIRERPEHSRGTRSLGLAWKAKHDQEGLWSHTRLPPGLNFYYE